MDEPTRYLSAPLAPMHTAGRHQLFLLSIETDDRLSDSLEAIRGDRITRLRDLHRMLAGPLPGDTVTVVDLRKPSQADGFSVSRAIDRLNGPTLAESWAEWVRVTGCS